MITKPITLDELEQYKERIQNLNPEDIGEAAKLMELGLTVVDQDLYKRILREAQRAQSGRNVSYLIAVLTLFVSCVHWLTPCPGEAFLLLVLNFMTFGWVFMQLKDVNEKPI